MIQLHHQGVRCTWCGRVTNPTEVTRIAVCEDPQDKLVTGEEPVCNPCLESHPLEIELVSFDRIKKEEKVMTWEITYRYENGLKKVFLVYKPEDLIRLVNNAPSLVVRVTIRIVSKEELACPDEDDEST